MTVSIQNTLLPGLTSHCIQHSLTLWHTTSPPHFNPLFPMPHHAVHSLPPPSHLTPPSHLPTLISPHSPSPHPTLPFYPAHPNLTPHSLHLSHLHLSTSPILTSPHLTHPHPPLPHPSSPVLTSLTLTSLTLTSPSPTLTSPHPLALPSPHSSSPSYLTHLAGRTRKMLLHDQWMMRKLVPVN